MSRGPDAHTLIERLFEEDLRISTGRIAASGWDRWASVTFTGARHWFVVEAEAGSASDAWLAALAEREFTVRGYLVADVAVTSVTREKGQVRARIELLSVELP